jgi:hypothetical protein
VIRRQGVQTGKRQHMALSARPIVAGLLALLIVLQGLAAIGTSLTRFNYGGGETSFVVSLLGVTCVVNAPGDDIPPAHERDHSQCSALCDARVFHGAALAKMAQIGGVIAPLWAHVLEERQIAGAPIRPPAGWASSWSSQAPPYFS